MGLARQQNILHCLELAAPVQRPHIVQLIVLRAPFQLGQAHPVAPAQGLAADVHVQISHSFP